MENLHLIKSHDWRRYQFSRTYDMCRSFQKISIDDKYLIDHSINIFNKTGVHLDTCSIKVMNRQPFSFDSASIGPHMSLCTISKRFTLKWKTASLRVIFREEQDVQVVDQDSFEMLRPATTFLKDVLTTLLESAFARRLCWASKSAVHSVLQSNLFKSSLSSTQSIFFWDAVAMIFDFNTNLESWLMTTVVISFSPCIDSKIREYCKDGTYKTLLKEHLFVALSNLNRRSTLSRPIASYDDLSPKLIWYGSVVFSLEKRDEASVIWLDAYKSV